MSHWTTSGRSRLKAKQSHGRSFSQKAQQRAAFVAAESMMMQGTVPREITTAANNKRNTETTRRRKNEARTKYSFCNPIARRGVAVSIGSANNDCHHEQQQQQQQQHQHHDDDIQIESGCDDSHLLSGNHPPQRRRIRRIRDASLRYRTLNSRRSTSSTVDSNTNNTNYRPHIEAHTCTTPHQSVQNNHQPSDGSVQYQLDSRLHNNVPNPTYEEIRDEVSDKIIPRRHLSGREIVAPPSASFQEEAFPSDYISNDDLDTPLQIQQDWHHQQTQPNIMNHPSQDYNDTTIMPTGRGGSQLQGGIKRFQMYNNVHVDPFEGAEVEGVKGALYDFTSDNSWGNTNPVAVAGNDPGSSTIIRNSTGRTDDDMHRDYADARNHNNYVDNTYFEQDQRNMMSQNALTRRLSGTTTGSSLLEGSYSQSQSVGISRFSKSQRKRIRSEMTETEEREHKSSSNYNQCGNGMFEQAITSSSSKFSDLTSSSGKDNHQGSLRFFDNSSEVDSRGNLLEESMSPQTKRILNFNALATREQNNKYDTVNGNEMLTMDRRYKSSTNIDKSSRQQQTATATSPDTNYLRGVEFENKSMWKYFG